MHCTINMRALSSAILLLQLAMNQGEKIDEPTLKPVDPFSASVDAAIFKEEMKEGCVTDRDKPAKIWFKRTYDQREQIRQFYDDNFCPKTYHGYYYTYRCPMLYGFFDMSTHSLEDLYIDSSFSPQTVLGETLYQVITGKWKEIGAIEEVVCGNDKDMKDKVDQYYKDAYKDSVENQLGTFRGDDQDYQHVMKEYCWKGRCQDKKMKPEDADKEANALRAIDPEKNKDEFKNKLIELIDKNCEPDLKMIFEKYRTNKDCGIGQAVDKAFKVDRVKRAYNHLVRYIEDTCRFYADELHEAVDGCGTDIDRINRIALTRSERDLGCILKKYKKFHGKRFTKRLIEDTVTEGRYRLGIRLLCGEND